MALGDPLRFVWALQCRVFGHKYTPTPLGLPFGRTEPCAVCGTPIGLPPIPPPPPPPRRRHAR